MCVYLFTFRCYFIPLIAGSSSSIAFDSQSRYFLMDNGSEGLNLYSLIDFTWIKTFPAVSISNALIRYPMQVAFSEGDSMVVVGDNDGNLRVFDVQDGMEVGSFRHSKQGSVQSVVVSQSQPSATMHRFLIRLLQTYHSGGLSWIIAGDSNIERWGVITIWQHQPQSSALPSPSRLVAVGKQAKTIVSTIITVFKWLAILIGCFCLLRYAIRSFPAVSFHSHSLQSPQNSKTVSSSEPLGTSSRELCHSHTVCPSYHEGGAVFSVCPCRRERRNVGTEDSGMTGLDRCWIVDSTLRNTKYVICSSPSALHSRSSTCFFVHFSPAQFTQYTL